MQHRLSVSPPTENDAHQFDDRYMLYTRVHNPQIATLLAQLEETFPATSGATQLLLFDSFKTQEEVIAVQARLSEFLLCMQVVNEMNARERAAGTMIRYCAIDPLQTERLFGAKRIPRDLIPPDGRGMTPDFLTLPDGLVMAYEVEKFEGEEIPHLDEDTGMLDCYIVAWLEAKTCFRKSASRRLKSANWQTAKLANLVDIFRKLGFETAPELARFRDVMLWMLSRELAVPARDIQLHLATQMTHIVGVIVRKNKMRKPKWRELEIRRLIRGGCGKKGVLLLIEKRDLFPGRGEHRRRKVYG